MAADVAVNFDLWLGQYISFFTTKTQNFATKKHTVSYITDLVHTGSTKLHNLKTAEINILNTKNNLQEANEQM